MLLSYNRVNPPEVSNKILTRSTNNFFKSEFYFLYIKNILDFNIEIKITYMNKLLNSWHSEAVASDPEAKDVSIVLGKGQDYIGVFTPQDIYQAHGMNFSYGCKKVKTLPLDDLLPRLMPLEECPVDRLEVGKYVWIYKKTEVDYGHILEKIDATESIFKHLKSYYPHEVSEILEIPKLKDHDSLNLKVENKKLFNDDGSCWYIGEWRQANNSLMMWGRGMFLMDGVRYVGQFVEHAMTGVGKKYNPDGSIITGNFVKFYPVGKCTFTHNDGRVETREYKLRTD